MISVSRKSPRVIRTVLCVMSSAPHMICVSSVDSSPPWPSRRAWTARACVSREAERAHVGMKEGATQRTVDERPQLGAAEQPAEQQRVLFPEQPVEELGEGICDGQRDDQHCPHEAPRVEADGQAEALAGGLRQHLADQQDHWESGARQRARGRTEHVEKRRVSRTSDGDDDGRDWAAEFVEKDGQRLLRTDGSVRKHGTFEFQLHADLPSRLRSSAGASPASGGLARPAVEPKRRERRWARTVATRTGTTPAACRFSAAVPERINTSSSTRSSDKRPSVRPEHVPPNSTRAIHTNARPALSPAVDMATRQAQDEGFRRFGVRRVCGRSTNSALVTLRLLAEASKSLLTGLVQNRRTE